MTKSPINLWANFLSNEKLTPQRVDALKLIFLAEMLAKAGTPKVRPHKAKVESRKLVCRVAIQAGIDLTAWKYHGKIAMGRGLLDAWNIVYQEQFGSTLGTAGAKEVVRRGVKTILGKASHGPKEV